jgi:NADH-quinone oxidoreductase subunit N
MMSLFAGISSVFGSVLGANGFTAPTLDYHGLAPDIMLAAVAALVLIVDLIVDETRKHLVTTIAGAGLILSLIPIMTLAVNGNNRYMFDGAYAVDNFALTMKALFIISGYIVLMMSSNYLHEGDYHEGEYSFLLICSLLGMTVMASSRDLISIFIALETMSIPAYMLAGWRKRDNKSNEAALKYYLLGVVASAVMLYGMSLLYGVTGATNLAEINESIAGSPTPILIVSIFTILVGFAFKVSAVPFHQWAPDVYEGAPTPITAFLSVASKAAGFVALINLVFIGFASRADISRPIFWILSAATMIVGNLIALRQTNIVRMLAYSSVAQAGFILAPFAILGASDTAGGVPSFQAIVLYLMVYAVMNLGAFVMVIIVARKTRSGEISSYGGLFSYAPMPAVVMSIFMFSLAGIPPLAGAWAKIFVFKSLIEADTGWGLALALIGAVSSVIGFFYYASVMREMWMRPVPDGDRAAIKIPKSLGAAMAFCALAVVVIGVNPTFFTRLVDLAIY